MMNVETEKLKIIEDELIELPWYITMFGGKYVFFTSNHLKQI